MSSLKNMAALAALAYVHDHPIIGVGSGSTVNAFIDALAQSPISRQLDGVCAASIESQERLRQHNIPVLALNAVDHLPVYFDGADQVNEYGYMVKGKGGALTREKVLASVSKQYLCMVEACKYTQIVGPVAIEVLEMARSAVARVLVHMGANPVYRSGYQTDNGHVVIDAHHLNLDDPHDMDMRLNQIPGVVGHGLFIHQAADCIVMATPSGVETMKPKSTP